MSSSSSSSSPSSLIPTELENYLSHNDASYHKTLMHVKSAETVSKLIGFYTPNRRLLPWRGDVMPVEGWDGRGGIDGGGTGTSASSSSTSGKRKVSPPDPSLDVKKQKNISSFFTATPKQAAAAALKAHAEADPPPPPPPTPSLPAIPISVYSVWVSEIMLQQTRVSAVIPYYIKWMTTFPTIEALANASEDQVNQHWQGLGFYRRARLLKSGAKYVMNDLKGVVPTTLVGLLALPGIGPYTAGAVASIALNLNEPTVDGNVLRVISRLSGVACDIKNNNYKDRVGWDLAATLIKSSEAESRGEKAGDINQALMEVGATYCSAGGTGIDENDPLKDLYISTSLGRDVFRFLRGGGGEDSKSFAEKKGRLLDLSKACSCSLCGNGNNVREWLSKVIQAVEEGATEAESAAFSHKLLPPMPEKKGKRDERLQMLVVHRIQENEEEHEGEYLMVRRPEKGLLANQFEFPSVCVSVIEAKDGGGEAKQINDPGEDVRKVELEKKFQHIYESCNSVGMDGMMVEKQIIHVFSHVRHFINITYLVISDESVSVEGYRFLTSKQMVDEVGVTSCVMKVLSFVGAHREGKKDVSKVKKKATNTAAATATATATATVSKEKTKKKETTTTTTKKKK